MKGYSRMTDYHTLELGSPWKFWLKPLRIDLLPWIFKALKWRFWREWILRQERDLRFHLEGFDFDLWSRVKMTKTTYNKSWNHPNNPTQFGPLKLSLIWLLNDAAESRAWLYIAEEFQNLGSWISFEEKRFVTNLRNWESFFRFNEGPATRQHLQ